METNSCELSVEVQTLKIEIQKEKLKYNKLFEIYEELVKKMGSNSRQLTDLSSELADIHYRLFSASNYTVYNLNRLYSIAKEMGKIGGSRY